VLARLAKETEALPGAHTAIARVQKEFATANREAHARRAAEALAQLAAAAALASCAPPAIAEMYAARRFSGIAGRNYGDPLPDALAEELMSRAFARA
jgi:putative acyl-CoA dehydrogenase